MWMVKIQAKSLGKEYICITYSYNHLRSCAGLKKEVMEKLKVVTVHLPEPYLQAIDELVRRRLYPNRAEAIRMALRDFIRTEVQISE